MEYKQRIGTMKKTLAILLALMLITLSTACSFLGVQGEAASTPQPAGEDGPAVFELPDEPDAPEAPAATPSVDSGITEQFHALDMEVFRWYVSSDGSTLHMTVADPSKYDIDRASIPMTFGEYTQEYVKQCAAEAEGYLARLHQIPRTGLSPADQLSYDVIEQYLETEVSSAKFEYYYEPLTEYSGVHANLPLTFALFSIESEQDVKDYLALFADVPRYMGQILQYEQQRAERGMFMTEEALDKILDACDEIIDSRDNSFLYATFMDALDKVPSLTDAQKQAYIEQNKQLIRNDYINAYRDLYKGLDALRKKCSEPAGMKRLGAEGLEYYEQRVQQESSNLLSVEETLELLKNEFYYLMLRTEIIVQASDTDFSKVGEITSGKTDTDLALDKSITESVLPPLPEHTLTITDVPEELQSMFSPAAYVIPKIDEWAQNTVYINPEKHDDTLLLTLAHEAYPGHLYQYVYQRALPNVGMTQKTLHYGGHSEGWSQLGEYLVVQNQRTYDTEYCEIVFNNHIIISAILPAIVSIYVNYQGYSKEAVKLKLETLFQNNAEELAESYYALAIEQPFYTMDYAVGFAQLMTMMRDAENELGDTFDQKAFLTAYLDMGPAYFNLLQERMDVWVDANMQEAA